MEKVLNKTNLVEIGRILAKEYFKSYIKENDDELDTYEIFIMGFKEFETTCSMIFSMSKAGDYRFYHQGYLLEIIIDKNTNRILQSLVFKLIES